MALGGCDAQGGFGGMVAGAALAPLPVLADAREDVVNGMTRCAGLDRRPPVAGMLLRRGPADACLAGPAAGAAVAAQAVAADLPACHRRRPRRSRLPATVTRAAVRTGPPPTPKKSGIFDVFGGSDVVNNAPIQSYQVTAKRLHRDLARRPGVEADRG